MKSSAPNDPPLSPSIDVPYRDSTFEDEPMNEEDVEENLILEDRNGETAVPVRTQTKKGGYALVGGLSNDENGSICAGISSDGPPQDHPHYGSVWSRILPESVISSPAFRRTYRVLTANMIPDDAFQIRGVNVFDGEESFKLLKFTVWTILLIMVVHPFIRWLDWEHDKNFTIHDFFIYDFNHVLLDIAVFFFVSRLYKRRGIDCMFPYIFPTLIGTIVPSAVNTIWFFRFSISWFEIVCYWPWELFVVLILGALLVGGLVVLHVKSAIEEGVFVARVVEITVMMLMFLAPYVSHPNFHFHHWYSSWLVGMHCNRNRWWSKAAMAYAWGTYINGIAVYGRDPILTCAYSYYVSTDIRCAYMKCFWEQTDELKSSGGGGHYKPFVKPDWHNCSASYVP